MGFARLIKTFVPGLFLLLGLGGYFDLVSTTMRGEPVLWPWVSANAALAIALISVAAIAVGILSNMIVFTFATDRLIRKPFSKGNESLESEEAALLRAARNLICRDHIATNKAVPLDLEYLLAREIALDKLTYLQESYWYYLEFQMNMGVALTVLGPLIVIGAFLCATWMGFGEPMVAVISAVALLLVVATLALLLKTARVNFARHRVKRFSMMLSAYSHLRRQVEPVGLVIPDLDLIRALAPARDGDVRELLLDDSRRLSVLAKGKGTMR